MADKYYAWSNFQTTDQNGRTSITTRPGDEVTASKLGLTDEQFQELIDSASVRKQPFPDLPETFTGSPIEYLKQQAYAAALAAENMAAGDEPDYTFGDVYIAENNAEMPVAPEPADVKPATAAK